MAQDEHRMLFDIRGKRRHVVKVVYAVLAILMGLSLFLVTGGLSLSSLFEDSNKVSSATAGLEEQQQRIERKVRKDPANPDYLLALTRAQVNTGNSRIGVNPETGEAEFTTEAVADYQQASDTWSRYLKATDEPNPTAAGSMAGTLFKLAEVSGSTPEITANVEAAVAAQEIAAKARPNLNSLSTLAIYRSFAFDYAGAKKAEEQAKKYATSKFDRENLENQIKEITKRSKEFQAVVAASKKAAKEGGGEGASKAQLENPFGGLSGGGLGG